MLDPVLFLGLIIGLHIAQILLKNWTTNEKSEWRNGFLNRKGNISLLEIFGKFVFFSDEKHLPCTAYRLKYHDLGRNSS